MKKIKVNFVDFWPGFKKENNYFYNLLVRKYEVIIDKKNPEILFYSCYNSEYLKYNCIRIFYTPENISPDFTACDFAFSFDYNKNKNHFRLPYYSVVIDKHNMLDKLETIITREKARAIWQTKTKFCCILVSNPHAKERLDFFKTFSKIKKVDSGGSVLNNIGGRVADKYDFIKDYKFVIAFENSCQEGYTTEKILDPIFKDCIPIYWGDPKVTKDFNKKRFVDYNDFDSEELLINRLLEIDQNDELAIEMLLEPPFSDTKIPHHKEHEQILEILSEFLESEKKPIAQQFWKYIHHIKFLYGKNKKRILARLQRHLNRSIC